MTENIENRYEFVYLYDVENGNPNGDPDAGNMPRIDPETGTGIITDVCIKRKIRNYVDITKGNKSPFEIHVREGNFLSENHKRAHAAIEKESVYVKIPDDLTSEFEKIESDLPENVSLVKEDDSIMVSFALAGDIKKTSGAVKKVKCSVAAIAKMMELFVDAEEEIAKKWMCKNFYDVRTFGAVMSTGDKKCGQVRGPVQLNFGKSIEPIRDMLISMSRTAAVRVDKPDDKGLGANKHAIPYALYRTEGYISAHLAKQTGFTNDDLDLLWESLTNMFDHDHSAARGKMNARKLIVFQHDSALGNAPAHKLFDLVKVSRSNGSNVPTRTFSDYKVEVDNANVPEGVNLEEKF
jgi:CRISPR-associated protein Csd2